MRKKWQEHSEFLIKNARLVNSLSERQKIENPPADTGVSLFVRGLFIGKPQ